VLGTGFGQLPTVNPALKLTGAAVDLASGKNPRDEFRGRDVVGKDAWESREIDSGPMWMDFAKYVGNQFGIASTLARPLIGSSAESNQDLSDRILSGIPGINRLIKVSDRGDYETESEVVDDEQSEKAHHRLHRPDAIRRLDSESFKLMQLPDDKLTDRQSDRKALLKGYQRAIVPYKKALNQAIDDENQQDIESLKKDMEDIARDYAE
jgi:hypothetical protein